MAVTTDLRMRAPAALLLTALGALGWSSAAGATARTSFETAGACTEIALSVPIEAATAREHVPDGFAVNETAGKARLGIFSERCTTSVDGHESSTSVIGGAGVVLDPAKSRAGCGTYALFWTNSRRDAYLRAYRELGWSMPLDVDGRFTIAGTGPSMVAAAHNRNDIASWDITVAGAGVPTPAIPFDSIHCNVGRRGLVKGGPFHHDFLAVGALAGTLQVEPGSLLWRLLGEREIVTAAGFYIEFTFDGTTTLVADA